MTKTDYRILDALAQAADGDLAVQSPSVIAKNLGVSRQYVSACLSDLVDRDLVIKIEDGYYRISDDGRAFLNRS